VTHDWVSDSAPTTHNVLHFGGTIGDIDDFVIALSSAWGAHYTDQLGAMQSSYGCINVEILPLDGTSPTITKVLESGPAGQSSGNIIPATAHVITLRTDERGRSHRGRIFLGPVSEAAQDGGSISSGINVDAQLGWEGFVEDMATADFPLLVASYKLEEANAVAGITAQQVAGTMRPRQSRLR
jgi:hypothetical protein